MNQIVLFVIFIFFGIFIYYIIKEQCKCDIVEGQIFNSSSEFAATEGWENRINQIKCESDNESGERQIGSCGFSEDTSVALNQIENAIKWSINPDNPCSPLKLIPVVSNLSRTFRGEAEGVSFLESHLGADEYESIQRYNMLNTQTSRVSNCINYINNDCTNSINPYHCMIEDSSDLDNNPISNHFLSLSLKKVLTPLNNYLMSSPHPNGICLKNGNRNLSSDQQIECVNAITGLAVTGPPIVNVNEDYFIKCKLYDSCKNIYENYVWWDEMNTVIADRVADRVAAEQQRQQRVNTIQRQVVNENHASGIEPSIGGGFGGY